MIEKTKIKLTLPTNLNIFDNLKEKSDYFSDLAFEKVKKEADRRINEYNKLSWWSKFCNKKIVKESFYIGLDKAYRYNRICSNDCILACRDFIITEVPGMYYLSQAKLASKTNDTIMFCRENGVGSIEIEDSDVKLLNQIEKEYSKNVKH